MKLKGIFSAALCLLLGATAIFAQPRITQEHKDRAADIVAQMTLDEKISYVGGYDSWGARTHEEYLLSTKENMKFTFGFKGI